MKSRVLLAHRARRLFFFIHLWIGLILGFWFALIGITGSVLAWRFELSGFELAQRFPIERTGQKNELIPFSAALDAMKKAHPDAEPKELLAVSIPNRKQPFYSFTRGKEKASRQTILIDPYTAKVHPPVLLRTLTVGTIQQFHQRLLLGAKGYIANGTFNFLVIPLLLSGLWLWWPTRLKHLRAHLVIKRGVSFKRTLYDLHNVMGIYLFPVLLLTTISGAMLVEQHVSADGGVAEYLRRDQKKPASAMDLAKKPKEKKGGNKAKAPTVTPQAKRFSDDELLEQARKLRPQHELTAVTLPETAQETLELTFAKRAGFNLKETVYLDPYSGHEVANLDEAPSNRSPLRRWTKTLHLGEYGGVFSKLIYTFTGLMPLGLFITGFLLWARKKRAKMQRAAA